MDGSQYGVLPLLLILLVFVALALLLRKVLARDGTGAPPATRPVEKGIRGHVLRDVDFIRRVLREVALDPELRSTLEEQLDRLEERTRRRDLYLAVIGEFNSGKSTFINALLRRRLLKSANIATTASATQLRHGAQLAVDVRFLDGARISATEHDSAALAQRLQRFQAPDNGPPTLENLIELVTAQPEASREVDTVEIELPAEWLGRGIRILETPGVGAGPEYAAHHQAVTERVLAQQADAAVVLISASSGITRTLLDFLDAVARPFLSRCLFVLTKMDSVEEEERGVIRTHVESVLSKFLGAPPLLLEAGALSVLTPAASQPEQEPERARWCEAFSTLEGVLFDAMTSQSPAIVAETLIRLLHQVIDGMNTGIAQRRDQLQQEQLALEANSVARLEETLQRIHGQCSAALDRTVAQVDQDLRAASIRFENRTKIEVGALIAVADLSNLKATITAKIPMAIAVEEQPFLATLAAGFALLDQRSTESHAVFTAEFETCYRNLKSLGIPQLAETARVVPQTRVSVAAVLQGTPFTGGPRWRDFIGITINKAKKRQELHAVLFPAIKAHVERTEAHWQTKLDIAASTIRAELDGAVQAHLREYRTTVETMIREHERRTAQLESEQATMRDHAAELQRRAGLLDELQQNLVSNSAPAL
ncbi:MAG: dynamin family protein [Paludibaculum sp.]